jgi:plasmid maintenance system killer protein
MGKREKVSISEMRDWLRRYELGDPVEKIAKEAKRDTRTVLKYLAQARKEADLRAARQNLFTKALTKHNDEMLKAVTNIIQALVVPNAQVEIRQDEQGNWQDIPLTAAKGAQTPEGTRIEFHDEDSVRWRLLAEHLGVDSPLERIPAWKKSMGEYLDTMKTLKLQIAGLLKTETGLDIVKFTYEKPSAPILFQPIVDYLFPISVNRATNVLDGTDPEHNLKIDRDGYLDGQKGWLSQDGTPFLVKIVGAIGEIEKSTEFRQLKSRHPGVQQITRKFRDELDEINLLGYIAGRCRVCERLEK